MAIFVIHKHYAKKLHYDLRLEIDNILKSWAVPKEPSMNHSIKRLAIAVDDHDMEYAEFEGNIEEGSYGAGKVEIWDKGKLDTINKKEKKIIFNLNGKKLHGTFVLLKFGKEKDSWLLFKKKEDETSPESG